MPFLNKYTLAVIGALLLLPCGVSAQAAARGKIFAKIGNWEVKRFPKYCVASIFVNWI